MKIILLSLSILAFVISFGQNDSNTKLPPIEMLKGKPGDVKHIYELPSSTNYKIYNQKGHLIDSGYAEFIDYTEYKTGTYFIKYDNKTLTFKKEHTPIISESNNNYLLLFLGLVALLFLVFLFFFGIRVKRIKKEQLVLLKEIENLKKTHIDNPTRKLTSTKNIDLDRNKIETEVTNKLNESDWKIINQIMENPTISNNELANQVSLSVEGTRSSLKKMYRAFEIPSSRNMRLTLVIKLVQISKYG
jgi:hypothetical protein